jgi:hypothetical protein
VADRDEAIDVSRLPARALERVGTYRATVAYQTPYGEAVLLKLAESSSDGLPLAVWVAPPVRRQLDLSQVHRNLDWQAGRTGPAPAVVLAGCFRRHPKAQRLSLDALDPSQISLR